MRGKRPNQAINTYTRTLTDLLTTTRAEAGAAEGGDLAYGRKAPFQHRTPSEDDGIGESPSPDTPSSMESNNNNNNNTNPNSNNLQTQGREEEIKRDDYAPDDSNPMVGNQSPNRAIQQSNPETQRQAAVPRSNDNLRRRRKNEELGRVDGRLLRIRANQWNQGWKKEE